MAGLRPFSEVHWVKIWKRQSRNVPPHAMPGTIVNMQIFLDGVQVLSLLTCQIGKLVISEVTNVETIKIPNTGRIAFTSNPRAIYSFITFVFVFLLQSVNLCYAKDNTWILIFVIEKIEDIFQLVHINSSI